MNTATLREILSAYFSEEELLNLCQDLGIDYEQWGRNKASICRELPEYCKRNTLLTELEAAIRRVKPHAIRSDLRDVQIADTFKGLAQVPGVEAIVVSFHHDLEASREQISVLGTFKDMHDLLHRLQFECYDCVLREARNFPDDETARDNIGEYEFTLRSIAGRLQTIALQPSLAAIQMGWVQDLAQACEELRTAVESADIRRLKRATALIKRVLTLQPSYINAHLIATARALRLHGIVESVERLRRLFTGHGFAEQQMQRLLTDIAVLSRLSQQLDALMRDHDAWQMIDRELRQVEVGLEQDITNLELSWPHVWTLTESLCNGKEDWTIALLADGASLTSAINLQEVRRIQSVFRRFRRQASNRFYLVDANLKDLCDQLRDLRDPLGELQRVFV